MTAGNDFPSIFENDNFRLRRSTGHNLYDPECLLTGGESAMKFCSPNRKSVAAGLDKCTRFHHRTLPFQPWSMHQCASIWWRLFH